MNLVEFIKDCRPDQKLKIMKGTGDMIQTDVYTVYTSPLAKLLTVDDVVIRNGNVLIVVE